MEHEYHVYKVGDHLTPKDNWHNFTRGKVYEVMKVDFGRNFNVAMDQNAIFPFVYADNNMLEAIHPNNTIPLVESVLPTEAGAEEYEEIIKLQESLDLAKLAD